MKHAPTIIRAVLFDWAGTTVDYGSRALVEAFVEAFRRSGIELTAAEARGPMGRAKRDHIAAIFALPRVVEAWASCTTGRPTTQTSIACTRISYHFRRASWRNTAT